MKASTLSKYESSKSEVKEVGPPKTPYQPSSDDTENGKLEEKLVDALSEKINKRMLEKETLSPVPALNSDSLLWKLEPDVEIKEHQLEEYTGFTVSLKDNAVASLRLKRQDSLRTLQEVLDVPTHAEDEKPNDSREVINFFSDARVGNVVPLPINPYSDPNKIWSGIELTVVKNDQAKKYVLKSSGLARWIIDEQEAGFRGTKSSESLFVSHWEVAVAEIVREKGKGPYVKLNIDKDHAVYLKPRKASDGELRRFMTDNYWPTPSTEEEVKLNCKVEFSLSK